MLPRLEDHPTYFELWTEEEDRIGEDLRILRSGLAGIQHNPRAEQMQLTSLGIPQSRSVPPERLEPLESSNRDAISSRSVGLGALWRVALVDEGMDEVRARAVKEVAPFSTCVRVS